MTHLCSWYRFVSHDVQNATQLCVLFWTLHTAETNKTVCYLSYSARNGSKFLFGVKYSKSLTDCNSDLFHSVWRMLNKASVVIQEKMLSNVV